MACLGTLWECASLDATVNRQKNKSELFSFTSQFQKYV